jgi:protein-tyrosine-phosphatase
MAQPGHILIVCTANICRSPMAAGLLRHALSGLPEPLRSLQVVSAGVSARTGEPVTPHSVTALKKAGIDISGHRSRPVTQELLDRSLAVFCMTEAHRSMIHLTADPAPKRLFLFREFMPAEAGREIADPYGGPLAVYDASRDEMVEAIPSVIRYLKTQVDPS